MDWQFGIAANAVIALMYAGIFAMIMRGLRAAGASWQQNPAGWATATIFLTCSLGHGAHLTHLLGLPGLAGAVEIAAARTAYDLHMAVVDLATAVVATTFWSLKLREGRGHDSAALYDDTPTARRTALRVNHDVVQGLALASYQLESGDLDAARATMDGTLEQARAIASAPFAHDELLPAGQLVGTRTRSSGGAR